MSHSQYEPPQSKPFGPEDDYPAVKEKKSHGCFFYGCITLVVLAVLALIATGVIVYIGYTYLQKQIETYTSTTRMPLPEVKMSDEQRKALDDRWAAFKTASEKGEAAEIVLTADEINALINENAEAKGKVFVTLKDDQVTGQLSIPLDGVPLVPQGRFLNATAGLTVELKDGYLDVRLKSIDVNGKTMPPNIAQSFSQQNLAKDVMNDPDTRKAISKFDSLKVKDSKVYIRAKAKSSEDEAKKGDTEKTEVKKDGEPAKDQVKKGDSEKSEVKKDEEPAKEAPKDDRGTKESPVTKPGDEPKPKTTPSAEPAKTDVPKAA
jgi:hypothetical protein